MDRITINAVKRNEFGKGAARSLRRKDMIPAGNSALYQSILNISDGLGTRMALPVIASGMTAGGTVSMNASADTAAGNRAGLWVGSAAVNKVSYASAESEDARKIPVSTSSDFQIRLIVHVNDSGQARLLQKVTLMWKEGTYKPDPEDSTKKIVDIPGRYVLVTDDSKLSQVTGSSLRDGQPAGRRISSAAFSFKNPILMSGSFDGVLNSGNIPIDYDDPLNPFKHKYHPNHDNLDYDFDLNNKLPEGKESYTVVRNISLSFTPKHPEGYKYSGWGDTEVGGIYKEKISGLNKESVPLYVKGIFILHHVCIREECHVLNDVR